MITCVCAQEAGAGSEHREPATRVLSRRGSVLPFLQVPSLLALALTPVVSRPSSSAWDVGSQKGCVGPHLDLAHEGGHPQL